ncbi:hypothetical protein ATW62_08935 [Oenococcus oeni]|nr:hypothetical protein ATW62_08935 [Oenococcus oeni]
MKYAIKNGLQLKIPSNKIGNAGYYGFAVKKGKNEALLKAFNRGLASIKKDGTYDKIVKKYLGEIINFLSDVMVMAAIIPSICPESTI